MQVDKDGKSYFTAAGGQYVADYASVKLEMTRLTDNKFATRLLKSPMMPEISVTFMVSKLKYNQDIYLNKYIYILQNYNFKKKYTYIIN